jgi:uncharacterized tellurite resistance protein B-like protein
MVYKRFYAEVGKLLYAIASADGRVDEKEYRLLRDIVRQKLVPMENNTDVLAPMRPIMQRWNLTCFMIKLPMPNRPSIHL